MKYIRTKDDIEALYINEFTEYGKEYYKNSKIADTVEELFDDFIWKWNEKEFPYSTARQYRRYGGCGDLKRAIRVEKNYGKSLNYDYEIYGAVWTDKGLIYKAKMKEILPNGEIDWELL